VNDTAGTARRRDESPIGGQDVLPEQARRDERPALHAEILRVGHPVDAEGHVARDDGCVEGFDHGDEPFDPRLPVGHVQEKVRIAAQVGQGHEGVPVAEAAAYQLPRRAVPREARGDVCPVDGTPAEIGLGIRSAKGLPRGPIRQGMPGDGRRDAVIHGLPHATPTVDPGHTGALPGLQRGLQRSAGTAELGKEQRVRALQLQQRLPRVVVPARGVDRVAHGDQRGPLEARRTQQVIPVRSHLPFPVPALRARPAGGRRRPERLGVTPNERSRT